MKFKVCVYRTDRTFGVFVQPGRNSMAQELLEGGFFYRTAAENAIPYWERQIAAQLEENPALFDVVAGGGK